MMTNAAIANTFTSSSIGIGRTVATNSTFANVGEVIIYPSEIIGVNRNKVETYLAIKYPLGYQRINREWQFQEKNGDTTALKIAYPASALP